MCLLCWAFLGKMFLIWVLVLCFEIGTILLFEYISSILVVFMLSDVFEVLV